MQLNSWHSVCYGMAFVMLKREMVSPLLLEVFVGYFQVGYFKRQYIFHFIVVTIFLRSEGLNFFEVNASMQRYILVTNNPSDLHMVRRNQSSLVRFRSKYYAQSGCKGSVTTSLHLVPFCQLYTLQTLYMHTSPFTSSKSILHTLTIQHDTQLPP